MNNIRFNSNDINYELTPFLENCIIDGNTYGIECDIKICYKLLHRSPQQQQNNNSLAKLNIHIEKCKFALRQLGKTEDAITDIINKIKTDLGLPNQNTGQVKHSTSKDLTELLGNN